MERGTGKRIEQMTEKQRQRFGCRCLLFLFLLFFRQIVVVFKAQRVPQFFIDLIGAAREVEDGAIHFLNGEDAVRDAGGDVDQAALGDENIFSVDGYPNPRVQIGGIFWVGANKA